MISLDIPFLADSSSGQQVSADGSRFQIQLDDPLQIPNNALSCYVSVQESTIWNTVPNILSGVNNHFYIDEGAGFVDVTIPQGLYDLPSLESACDREYVSLGGTTGLFAFVGDDSTQKVIIQINVAGVQIDLTQADTFRDIIGFDSQLVPAAPSVGYYTQSAENVANFNTINYFLIHSDLVSEGIRFNNSYDQIIAKVSITTPPGSLIVDTPNVPPRSPASNLIGITKNVIRFRLTDQNGAAVNTAGESWSCRIQIEYSMPIPDRFYESKKEY